MEIHEASIAQLDKIAKLIKNNKSLGLTGTATNKTREEIYDKTGMHGCFNYTIEEAVRDGILADYEINIHTIELDNKKCYIPTSKGKITEKWRYEQLTWLERELKKKKKPTFFLDLKIINLLQNSISKQQKTIELLDKYKDERVLVFCGTTNIADNLGIPSYHSKSNEKDILNDFCIGIGNHLSSIRMLQAGITLLPLNRCLINMTNGAPEVLAQKVCRVLGYESLNPNKKAYIDIVVADCSFDRTRLNTSLSFFDTSKINYI